MFDKPTAQTDVSHGDIDFLHTDDHGTSKLKSKKEPVALAHVPSKTEQKGAGSFSTLFRSFLNLFSRGDSKKDRKPTLDPTPVQEKKKIKLPDQAPPRVQSVEVMKFSESKPSFAKDSNAVDPFEVKSAPSAPSTTPAPSPEPAVVPKTIPPVAPPAEQGKENFSRLKNVPLNELHSSTSSSASVKEQTPRKEKEQKKPGASLSHHAEKPSAHDVFDVNLLPAQKKHLSVRAKKLLSLGLVGIEFLGLLLVFLLWQARADGRLLGLRDLESKTTLLEIQIKGYKPVVADAAALQKRVSILKSLFAGRKDPNLAFGWLEANTLQTVFYDNFSLSNEGRFHIGLTAGDVVSAAQQLKLFLNDPAWKQVDMSGLTLKDDEKDGSSISYDLLLTPQEEFYHPTQQE